MAYVMCDKHGGHGASAVCAHLHAAVLAGESLGAMSSLMVEFEGTPLGPIWFCEDCARRYGIPADGLRLTGDEGLEQMFEWGWVPVCPLCFYDAGGQDSRRTGWVSRPGAR